MDSTQLKQAISDDLETIKRLDLDIVPANDYYRANARAFMLVSLRIYGLCLGACIMPALFREHWHVFFEHSTWIENGLTLALSALAFTLFSLFMLHSGINHYVIFNLQLRQKFKTGDVLLKKMQFGGWVAFSVFGLINTLATFIADPGLIFFAEIIAAIPTAIITSMLIEMETNRIGLSALTLAVNKYLSKDYPKEDIVRPSK